VSRRSEKKRDKVGCPPWQDLRLAVAAVLLGGISFWLPVTIVEWVTKRELSVAVGLILHFVTELGVYFLVARRWKRTAPSLALYMCLGLYVLGPLLMEIGYTALQGGFTKFQGWHDIQYLILLSIPPMALWFAGLQATPMILSSAVLLWRYFRFERNAGGPAFGRS